MTDIAKIAAGLDPQVRGAVLMCPFNSRRSGIRGGKLVPWIVGNSHRSGGKVALFIRKQCNDFSGDYTLTETGLAVRDYLKERGHDRSRAGEEK